ncbi:MAG: hypothetical protein VKJ64_17910 [Leptolyngbyaceae bacterium]|nr:hypothetical protein [Leptolyngbyaceae bacterium]
MDNRELKDKYFAALRDKYQIGLHRSFEFDGFLYLILRKVELGIQITSLELQWLTENRLFKTIEIISLQQYQAEEFTRFEEECSSLRVKYKIPEDFKLSVDSLVYSILWKLETGKLLTDSELGLIKRFNLKDTIGLIEDILSFSKLKTNYKATQHGKDFPEEPLYSILQKIDNKELLSEDETNWLLDHGFQGTLEIYWQQEKKRKAIAEFAALKIKYKVDTLPNTSLASPLYAILKKLEEKQDLDDSECRWLEQQQLNRLAHIDRTRKDVKLFKKLKTKYQATGYKNTNPSSRLFLILKTIASEITEDDINWLIGEDLLETAEMARAIHFRLLKAKYSIVGQLDPDPFYEIMLKLERAERLDPKQVVQLIEDGRLSRQGKIAIAHYKLEAIFYEEEYKRTSNKWNLPSASSNWRKANEPQKALAVTHNVNWVKIKEDDLKSALWVTRGAAFRGLGQLDEAENCAAEAMDCHPESHQPYTLMGAIHYDRGEYLEGDKWFEMAAERGANDVDDEIERVVRMTKDKDKRREVAEYLVRKDPVRYGWANSYLK